MTQDPYEIAWASSALRSLEAGSRNLAAVASTAALCCSVTTCASNSMVTSSGGTGGVRRPASDLAHQRRQPPPAPHDRLHHRHRACLEPKGAGWRRRHAQPAGGASGAVLGRT